MKVRDRLLVKDVTDNRTNREEKPLRLAIIGCGAITQSGHAPGALLSRRTKLTTLVDLDIERARALGAEIGVDDCRSTLEGLENDVDIAIVAVPHRAHLPVGVEIMSKGIHVLMEKPLGCSVEECETLAKAAYDNNVVLAVALVRRFIAVNRTVKQFIDLGFLGKPISFEMYEAREFSWPLATNFLLDPAEPGRGVLIGNGAHMFDLVLWWFGEVADVACQADSKNGAESDATVDLKLKTGVTGRLHLSRVRDLGACINIEFEKGRIIVPPFGPDIQVEATDGPLLVAKPPTLSNAVGEPLGIGELMALQLDDFAAAVRGESAPAAGAEIATAAVSLVERCRDAINLTQHSWWEHSALPDKTVARTIPAFASSGNTL